jgi:hypothetical protein
VKLIRWGGGEGRVDEPILHSLPSRAQVLRWREMTPAQKLEMAFGLNRLARDLAEAGRKARRGAG